MTLVAHWMKEDDDACPFCTGLHGKPESEWPAEVASGPPAHPSCRCRLDWQFVSDNQNN